MRVLLVSMGLLLLASCTHAPKRADPTGMAQVPLASPDALAARSASQVIHAVYGARVVVLRTAIQLDSSGLRVVGVTATGQRLFTARWDGKTVSAEKSAFVPDSVDPQRVLADMQLALWPLASVQAAFAGAGLEVSEPFAGVRRLRRGDALIAEVHYATADPWAGRLWLANFEFDYSLTIDTSLTVDAAGAAPN
jgi:hypothetical protein